MSCQAFPRLQHHLGAGSATWLSSSFLTTGPDSRMSLGVFVERALRHLRHRVPSDRTRHYATAVWVLPKWMLVYKVT